MSLDLTAAEFLALGEAARLAVLRALRPRRGPIARGLS